MEEATSRQISEYIEHLLDKGLKPKTINCHLDSIRGFYHYLHREEDVVMVNPVKRGYALRLPRPLPRYLKDDEVERFLSIPKKARDHAIFYLMLRCGGTLGDWLNRSAKAQRVVWYISAKTPIMPF